MSNRRKPDAEPVSPQVETRLISISGKRETRRKLFHCFHSELIDGVIHSCLEYGPQTNKVSVTR